MIFRTTTVSEAPLPFKGGKWTLTMAFKGRWPDPETGRQHVATYLLAAILADHAGDAQQAAAWLGDAVSMAWHLGSADRQGSHEDGVDGDLDALRRLARKAVDACAQREVALAAMSPRERRRAIAAWARKLAADAAEWTD